jgi:hypothetical protein
MLLPWMGKEDRTKENEMKKIAGILMGIGLACVANAAVLTELSVVESGTWYNAGTDAANETVTVFGASGNTTLNANGGFKTLLVFDTQDFTGTITSGTLSFSVVNGPTGDATNLTVDFLGMTDDADFDAAEGYAFASQSVAATDLYSAVAVEGTTLNLDLVADEIDDGTGRYAVYCFSDTSLATSNNQSAISGYSLTVIPEPATIGMLGLGAAGLLVFRRQMK